MGLESIQIALELEESLAVSLPDNRASACRTPAQLHQLACDLLGLAPMTDCTSARIFRAVRCALVGDPETRVHPEDRVAGLVGPLNWRRSWSRVRGSCKPLDLPLSPPSRGQSVRDLVWQCTAHALRSKDRTPALWTRETVALRVRAIVSETLAIPPSFRFGRSWSELGAG